jgi:hypothetical protein
MLSVVVVVWSPALADLAISSNDLLLLLQKLAEGHL